MVNDDLNCTQWLLAFDGFLWLFECEGLTSNYYVSGKVILASTKAVYVLVPLPMDRQIQDLLANHRVEEALILTEGAQRNIPKDKFQVLCDSHLMFILAPPIISNNNFAWK